MPALNLKRKSLASLLLVALAAASLALVGSSLGTRARAADLPATSAAAPAGGGLDLAELDALLQRMDQNGADVRSIHVVVLTRWTQQYWPRPPQTLEMEEEMWFEGGRVRFERRDAGPRRCLGTETSVFDGRRLTTITKHPNPSGPVWVDVSATPALDLLAYSPEFGITDRLMRWPLNALALGVSTHHSRLGWQGMRLMGEEQIGGLACTRIVLLPENEGPQTTTYESLWVAPARDYAAARSERHRVFRGEESQHTYGEVWQAEEWVHPTEGLWLPSVVVHRRYDQIDASGKSVFVERRAQIVTSEFNVPIPEDIFRLEIPAEAVPRPHRCTGIPR